MRTSISLFGKRIGMARRANRRMLLIVFYASFSVVLALSWALLRSGNEGSFGAIEFTLLLGPILGGYFARSVFLFGDAGLVEPFDDRKVLYYPKNPGMSYFRSLFHPKVDPDRGLRADERSIRDRNKAGFAAFNSLGTVVMIAFLVDWIGGDTSGVFHGLGLSPDDSHRVVRLLLQVGYLLSFTLPQAILLWTEPDMEEVR